MRKKKTKKEPTKGLTQPSRPITESEKTKSNMKHSADKLKKKVNNHHKEAEILKIIMENTDAHLAYLDRDFNFVLVNSAYARGSGHTIDDLIGKNHFVLFPNQENQKIFERVRDTGEAVEFVEKPFEYVDQPERGITYWTWTLTPIKDERNTVQGLVLSLIDVTEQKKAELALHSSEQKFKTLAENAPDIIARFDRNLRYMYVNPLIESLTGTSREQCIGKTNEEVGLPEFLCKQWNKTLRKIFATAKPQMVEFDHPTKEGIQYLQMRGVPEYDDNSKVNSVLVIVRDNTREEQILTQLRSAKERLEYLFTSTRAVIYTAQITGNYGATYLSKNAIHMTGYASQTFIEDADFWITHVHPDDRPFVVSEIEKLFKKGQLVYEYRFLVKDGSYIWVRDEMRLVRDDHGSPQEIVGFWVDITDRKEAEEALRRSEEQYALAQRAAHIGSWDWDLKTGDIEWSETLESIYGFKRGGFGGTFEAVIQRIHPDDRQQVTNAVDLCIKEHRAYEHEHRVVWEDGSVHWVLATGNVILDESGKAIRMLGVARDITDHKKAEERKLTEARMKAVMKELKEIVALFDAISSAVVLVQSNGIVKYLNERARDVLALNEGQNIKDQFASDLMTKGRITNEVFFSRQVERSFLVSRQQYKDMFLFLFELLQDELKIKRMLRTTMAPYTFDDIVGLEDTKRIAQDLAVQNVNILILGESGTGKELLASAIHNASARAGKQFIPINCGAIPATLFESELFGYKKGAFTDARHDRIGKIEFASNGTLFFDEIGDLPLHIQSKLLRVIEDKTVVPLGGNTSKKVDVRFIFATNRDLEQMVQKARFRKDLYYRINAPVIRIPPLRERKHEIEALVRSLLIKLETAHHRFTTGISDQALARLLAYDYPGNVRELEGLLKNAYLSCRHEKIEIGDLKLGQAYETPIEDRVQQYRVRLVYESFLAHGGDIELTAHALGLSSRQVYRYLKKYRQNTP